MRRQCQMNTLLGPFLLHYRLHFSCSSRFIQSAVHPVHLIYHSPSPSHSPYLEKLLILDKCLLLEAEGRWFLVLLVSLFKTRNTTWFQKKRYLLIYSEQTQTGNRYKYLYFSKSWVS